jgi:hypothetical protein
LFLTWLGPTQNAAGRPLTNLERFEVWGADYPKKGFCEGCPVSYRKVGEVFPQIPAPGLLVNEGPYAFGYDLNPERVYRFKVAGFSSRGAANPNSWREITVYGQAPPGSPSHFSAAAEDLATRISWGKPQANQKVEIQKLAPGHDWVVLEPSKPQDNFLLDLDVVYGRTYGYRARLLSLEGDSLTPGPFSREIQVRIEDLTPPRPVGFLDASMSDSGVSLRWENLSEDNEVAGYRVYRRLAGETGFKLISGLVPVNVYTDNGVKPGETAYYEVTAVDKSPAANESRPSPTASVLAAVTDVEPEKPVLVDPGL